MEKNEVKDFPEPIIKIINALNNKYRRKILILLSKNGDMAWNEIKNKIDIENGKINYHLKILQRSGIIRNYIKMNSKEIDRSNSFYNISNLGNSVLQNLFNSLSVKESNRIYNSSTMESYNLWIFGVKEGNVMGKIVSINKDNYNALSSRSINKNNVNKYLYDRNGKSSHPLGILE